MPNERAKAEMHAVLEEVQEQMRQVARIQQERVQLTASVTVRKRVTVTVNADGTVIETKFGSGIADLSYAEIARAVTEAAQGASAEVARKGAELMQPFQERRSRLPKLSDLVEGMPDFGAMMPAAPPVSTAPLNSAERVAELENVSGAPEFEDVEVRPGRGRDGGVTDSGW
ncbi:YbaB/EbfC family nucleoid-associated protein [Nocardia huaxiensis]|uniref:YbaB/EbfC family nucleoid-associated protein n=1 Tax=Nocardia huaxiensis TaxID=2755382 RepID=A0A7D6VKV3_9NOCA|nr:YbaB/EbfC family nucleoid-associated protein [Nocardia huaxiensis]QLY31850.1 YbaB/EbfC family nucleoid-associated protein [Nocardia huaxiensis]